MRESEERFRFMADAAPVMIWLDDENAAVTYFSKPWLDFTGRPLEAELGLGWCDGVHPDDLERIRGIEAAARPELKPFYMEYRLRRQDGEYRWVFDSAQPRWTPAGTFAGYIGSAVDVTERRRAEQAVHAQHEFLRRVIDADPNLVFAKDWNGRFTLANHAVAELYGTTVENLVGKTDTDFNINPAEIEHFLRDDREVMQTGRTKLIVEEPVTDSRSRITRWFQTIKVPLAPAGGGRNEVLGVSTDISARKRSERLQSALYRIAATTSSAEDLDEFYVAIHGIVGELMYAKKPLRRALRCRVRDALVSLLRGRGRPGAGAEEARQGPHGIRSAVRVAAARQRRELQHDGRARRRRAGGLLVGRLAGRPAQTRRQHLRRSRRPELRPAVPLRRRRQGDADVRLAADRRGARTQARAGCDPRVRGALPAPVRAHMSGVYRTTLSGRILECNEAMARIFGYDSREELLGKDIRILYPSDEDWQGFRESLLQFRNLTNYELQGARKDGSAVWTLENAALLADEAAGEVIVEGTATDITERKLLEEQLRQSQKMEASGSSPAASRMTSTTC